MSLFSSFKKALGFPEEYEDLDDISDLEDQDEVEVDADTSDATDDTTTKEPDADNGALHVADEILASFATEGNEEEKVAARNLIAEIIHCYLDESKEKSLDNLKKENERLRGENATQKARLSQRDQSKSDLEASRLSTTRQKRAFSERLAEMERQITTLEAEREQLQLENRSMINKLRGAPMPVVVNNPMVSAEIKRLNEENERLNKELGQVKKQLSQSDKQLKALQGEETISDEELADIERKLTEYENQHQRREENLKTLKLRIAESDAEKERLMIEITESKNAETRLKSEIESLKETIASNLKDHAESSKNLSDEIARLKQLIESHQSPTEEKKSRKEKRSAKTRERNSKNSGSLKISAIDELMESTDWFLPPPPGPRRKDPEVEENFGYKEQPRKSSKSKNDNQLTLF